MTTLPVAAVFFFIAMMLSLVFILIRNKKQATVHSPMYPQHHTEHREGSAAVLCPRCHAGMRTGFTVAERGIAWCDGDKKIPSRFSLAWFRATLPNTLHQGLSLRMNAAWKCDQCKLVLIDHSALEKPPEVR
jgi:hypothetical protein